MNKVRVLFGLGVMVACVCLAVGCGGSGSSATANGAEAEAHIVTVGNAICRRYNASIYIEQEHEEKGGQGSGPAQFVGQKEAELERLRVALGSTSESPQVRSYISSLVAQERLLAALYKEVKKGYEAYTHLALSKSYRDESHRLDIKLAAGAQALGLDSCIGQRPRHPIAG
jgi:hypothetical protein